MIDHTLSSSGYLFAVNRDRELMTARMRGQRKAFWLTFGIVFVVTVEVLRLILR